MHIAFFEDFPFPKNIRDMAGNHRPVSPEKRRHLLFCQPYRFAVEFDIELYLIVFRFEQHNLVFHLVSNPHRYNQTFVRIIAYRQSLYYELVKLRLSVGAFCSTR